MKAKTKKKRRIASQRGEDDMDINAPISQEDFANMIGETQQFVSRLCHFSVLNPEGKFHDWNVQYIRFQMGRIYANRGWKGLAIAAGDMPDDHR